MNHNRKVSIYCTTYNHEKYIKDAIEGFLIQKTDFEFEIVIHDDASTDATAHILSEYEKKYPELIRVIYENENQYNKFKYPPQFFYNMMRNELKGDYIAWCEGDDYWIDANKLQIQIDYMESQPDCVMTVHSAERLNCQTGEKSLIRPYQEEKDLSSIEVIKINIPTASCVFKREMLNMDDFFLEIDVGDYPLQVYCITKGKVHYFDKNMSVYRYMGENSWSNSQIKDFYSILRHLVSTSFFFEKYNKYTKGIYDKYIKEKVNFCLNQIPSRCHALSIGQFLKICVELNKENDYKMNKYYVEIMKLFRQYYDPDYLDSRVADFIKSHKYILIWGAGNFGRLLSEQFHNNGIEFVGFIVSDNKNSDKEYLGKTVWNISKLPFEIEEIGIVIAVRRQLKEEILEELYNVDKIEDYIYPFEIDVDYLME